MRRILVIMALVLLALPVCAQNSATLDDLLTGKTYPLTMKLKDLNRDWTRLNIAGQSDYLNTVMSAMSGSSLGANVYFTKRETAKIGDVIYMIAYHAKSKPLDMSALTKGAPPTPEKPSGDTDLSLALVNLATAGNLTDMRPFDLTTEVAESEQTASANPFQAQTSEAPNDKSLSNLKELGLAMRMYLQDYDNVMPQTKDWPKLKAALKIYVKDPDVFVNPITKQRYGVNPAISGHNISHISNPSAIVLFYETTPASDGTRGVSFLNDSVRRIKESDWPKVKSASKMP
jgi:hypothetical protein